MGDGLRPCADLRLKGIVLAGGKSLRYGSDKALAFHDGERFVEKAVGALRALGLYPAVITRPGRSYSFLACPVIEDKIPDYGPLGGIYTAMSVFRHGSFLVLTCDMPLVSASALSYLLAESVKSGRGKISVFSDAAGIQPFPGFYPREVLPALRESLIGRRLSMRGFLQGHPKNIIPWIGDPEALMNINRAQELPS